MILKERFSQTAIGIQELLVTNANASLTVPPGTTTCVIQGLHGKIHFRGFDFNQNLIQGWESIQPGHEFYVFHEKPIWLSQIPGIKFRRNNLANLRFISREPSRLLASYYIGEFGR